MNEYEIINLYTRIRFHFLEKAKYDPNTFFSGKNLQLMKKFVNVRFFENKTPKAMALYFVWIFYTHQHNIAKEHTSSLYQSEEFEKFKSMLSFYILEMEKDFTKVYNTKGAIGFDNLQKLMYKKQISPITYYVLINTVYKAYKPVIQESNIFSIMWKDITLLMTFIQLDKEFIKEYVDRFKI